MDIILLFPGQGSQKLGMARDLADAYSAARAVLDVVDGALAFPLSRLCFEGPEAELTRTENAQPALLAHGAAVWAVLHDRLAPHVRAAAGHSLGEFTAYHAGGALTLWDVAVLVRRRGELMRQSGEARPGAMAAIMGLAEDAVEAVCARASEVGIVVPANYNSPDQLVVSGELAAVERAMALAKEAGAKRAIRLNVSGAFHSPLMEIAVDGLRQALHAAQLAPPAFPIYTNVSAKPPSHVGEARDLLLAQLTAPVRWTAQVRQLAADYPGALFVELGPGVVLSNLVKRIVPGACTAPAGTATTVEQLLQRVA